MKSLIEFSRRYGADSSLVLAGGGNTSMKEKGVLHVKASGYPLSAIDEDGFVAMDLEKLLNIMKKSYPDSDAGREAAFLADVMDAKLPGQENKRPSVETLLHALFPRRYVLHLHPTLINALTCARNGKDMAAELFPGVMWVPECKPGYSLAKLMAENLTAETDTVLLENHGVFFAADTAEELNKMLSAMLNKLSEKVEGYGGQAQHEELRLDKPLTPDHLVYCGLGPKLPDNDNARALWRDANEIAGYARVFGGVKPMSDELTAFISNWEAESYRRKQA